LGAIDGVEGQPAGLGLVDGGCGVGVVVGQPQQRAEPGGGVGVLLGCSVAFLPVRHAGLGGLLLEGLVGVGAGQFAWSWATAR